jgi:3-hydroxyisobutyrate dehydrogenase-like beta-hydroxyacid dehydrogenase
MGIPIAERLLAAGYPLSVFNRTPEKADPLVELGAHRAEPLPELLTESDVCITMVSDDAALEAVTSGPGGVLSAARAGTVLVDMSTVSVAASTRVAEAAREAAVDYLRAPVSGNPVVVRAGNLTVVVSGPQRAFDATTEILTTIGPNVYYVGGGEEARVVKLALQVMVGGTAELLSEALIIGDAGGVDRAKLLEVMGASAIGSPFVKYKSEPLLRDDYTATFTAAMMKKDVELILDLASASGASLPFTSDLDALLESAIEGGYGELDLMALHLQLQDRRDRAASPGV